MSRRTPRLAEEIREQVAALIRDELKDPRIGFVTITRVELAHDLSLARVFVGVLGDEAQRERTLAALQNSAGFVRRQLGRRLRTHHTPEFLFQYDVGLDATDRVARLLAEVQQAPGGSGAPPEAPQAPLADPEPDPKD